MPAGQFLVLSVDEKVTRTKKPYLALKLRPQIDSPLRETGGNEISAVVWSEVIVKDQIPAKERVIAINYEEQEWGGGIQLTIKNYRIQPPEFPKDLFVLPLPTPAVDQEKVYNKLFCHQWKSDDMNGFFKNLRALLEASDGYWKRVICEIPAGVKNHHSYRAGLLKHIEEMWDFAELLMQTSFDGTDYKSHLGLLNFPELEIDREIVLAGIVMHDLGKCHDYSPDNYTYDETRVGAYFGHTCWGAMKVLQLWPPNGDRERCMKLIHVVLAHHGSPQTGAPIETKVAEATLLHIVDSLSARMDVHKRAIQESRDGSKPNFSKMLGATPITPTWPLMNRKENGTN